MDIVQYFANGLGLAYSLYQSGFYNFSPMGFMPWLNAKFDLDMPVL